MDDSMPENAIVIKANSFNKRRFLSKWTKIGDNAIAINGGAYPRLEINEKNPRTQRVSQEIEPDR